MKREMTLRAAADAAWVAGWNAMKITEGEGDVDALFVATADEHRLEIARRGGAYTVTRYRAGKLVGAALGCGASGAILEAQVPPC